LLLSSHACVREYLAKSDDNVACSSSIGVLVHALEMNNRNKSVQKEFPYASTEYCMGCIRSSDFYFFASLLRHRFNVI